jgi:hypothetical protein
MTDANAWQVPMANAIKLKISIPPVETMVALQMLRRIVGLVLVGAGNGIRTRDFNLGKVALYH